MRISRMPKRIQEYVGTHRRKKKWMTVVSCLAAVVVFCTVYALILPAVTITEQAYCGIEAHVHSEECFEQRLICTIPEGGHVHTEECYSEEWILTCGQEESEEHIHTDECYETSRVLTCGLEEDAHTHTEECYESVLVCEKEEHEHTLACFSNPNADIETQDVWEQSIADVKLTGNWSEDVLAIAQSQMGYTESEKNYVVAADGTTKKGYTRYGAWYGDSYGDWCAMFVSFCLKYAEVEHFPLEAYCPAWIETLQKEEYNLYHDSGTEYIPKAGDLIFFDWDADQVSDHVGLVCEVQESENAGEETAAEGEVSVETDGSVRKIITIEGNAGNCVKNKTYDFGDSRIMGYGELPEHIGQGMLAFTGEDYTVSVYFTEEAQIPVNAVLSVRELTGEEYEESCRQAKEAMGVNELSFARFFDVSFLVDGVEIEPSAPVEVKIQYAQHVEVEEGEVSNAIHFTPDGTEVLDMETVQEDDASTTFSFTQNSFSTVGTAVGAEPVAYASTPPETQSGKQTDELVVGGWYILYIALNNGEGYAVSATDPANGVVKLDAFSTDRGQVIYTGSEDILWEYTEQGFRNRRNQYLTLVRQPESWWESDVGLSYDTSHAGVTYSGLQDAIYNEERSAEPNGGSEALWYNTLWGTKVWPPAFYGKSDKTLGTNTVNAGEHHYIAYVGGSSEGGGEGGGGTDTPTPVTEHPLGSITGTPKDNELTLYNVDASGDDTPKILAGVAYTIYESVNGQKGRVIKSLATVDSFALPIGELPQGTYIVEQTDVPDGYIVYPQTKTFTVDANGQATVGVFYDYKAGDDGFITDKTAQVIDYVKRTYAIDLSAASGKYGYTLDALNFALAVDQSNSMLFPAELTKTGKEVTLYAEPDLTKTERVWNFITGWVDQVTVIESDRNNKALNDEDLDLDKSLVYYIITDENTTSTVWAIWYDDQNGGWCYQDASYYAKAQFHHELGLEQNVKETIDGADTYVAFAQSGDTFNAAYHDGYKAVNGGGFNQTLGSQLGSETADGNSYTLYTGSKYNRLHELQEGVSILANLLGSLNEKTTMQLVTFCSTVDPVADISLDNSGIEKVVEEVNKITTSGGTRQDLALDYVKDHLKGGTMNYVILITDGAPSGTKTDKTKVTTTDVETSATNLKNKGNVTLVTVGLSMANVTGGSTMLENAASPDGSGKGGKWCYAADKTGDLADVLINQIFGSIAKLHFDAATSVIQDTVSDSFYLIDPATNEPLAEGTWIDLDGNVLVNPTTEQKKQAGQVFYDSAKKEWRVEWSDQILPVLEDQQIRVYPVVGDIIGQRADGSYYIWSQGDSTSERVGKVVTRSIYSGLWVDKNGYSSYLYSRYIDLNSIQVYGTQKASSWHGRLYVKAKEDFIGGNVIDTNKSATITLKDGEQLAAQPLDMETPTVNVRLLPMEDFEGEAIVFLGDTINRDTNGDGVPDVLEDLTSRVDFIKLIPSLDGDKPVYNKAGATEDAGCMERTFTVSYATRGPDGTGGKLTADEWTKLKNGESVTFPYTYDDDSSHGPVGYFTLTLDVDTSRQCTECGQHFCDHVGEDVLAYSLKLTYTAYKQGEGPQNAVRPAENVHNGENGPGTEVGSAGTSALENGKGVVEASVSYEVSVVDGKITVIKELDQPAAEDTTFTFELFYQGITEDSGVEQTPYARGTILIPKGQTSGTETHVYLYSEKDADGNPAEDASMRTTDGKLVFQHLKRGSYVVQENQADDSEYVVKEAAVVEGNPDTNCPSHLNPAKTTATFHIGYHPVEDGEADNIIIYQTGITTDGHHIIYSVEWQHVQPDDPVTEYHGESYGTVRFLNTRKTLEKKIPVQKLWDASTGGAEAHADDTVYVALFKDADPVLNADGRVQLLKLSADGWKGEFTVNIAIGETVEDYSVREVGGVTASPGETLTPAVVVNDENALVYYETAAENHEVIRIGDRGYLVTYGGSPATGLNVMNAKTYELPKSGGPGVIHLYFLGGIFLITAVGYGYSLRRRHERRRER